MAHTQEWEIKWLNDAYGMENTLIEVLEDHQKQAEGHPELQAKITQHLDDTKHHADLVKECIERLGGSPSSTKAGLATMMGKVQGKMGGTADDELIKNGISDFAAENMEIASYSALIATAQTAGDQQTVSVCERILADEQDMAAFLQNYLPGSVKEFVGH